MRGSLILTFLIFILIAPAPAKEKKPLHQCDGITPAISCKTCVWCSYCGTKGKHGDRPANSATCPVCAGKR